MIEDRSGQQLGGRVLLVEADDPLAVARLEIRVSWIGGVHAEGVIKAVEPVADRLFDDLEIANHLVVVEVVGFQHELDLAGVAVGKPALIRVLSQHVAVLDLDGFADAVGHKEGVVAGKWRERSGAADVAEQFDVQAVAIAETVGLASCHNQLAARRQLSDRAAFRHQQDLLRGNRLRQRF